MGRNRLPVMGAVLSVALMFVLVAVTGCVPVKPSESNFKTPVVTLDHVEVANYWGWYYYSKKIEPTKGPAADRGAPLVLAFVFDVTNPNEYPVEMETFKFTVAFEEFELNTVNTYETMWVPAGKTSQYRVIAVFDARTSLLSLGVTGGFKLKEKNIGLMEQLEAWWTGIASFSFPIYVKEGTAGFSADGISAVSAFSGVFPQ